MRQVVTAPQPPPRVTLPPPQNPATKPGPVSLNAQQHSERLPCDVIMTLHVTTILCYHGDGCDGVCLTKPLGQALKLVSPQEQKTHFLNKVTSFQL